MASLSLRLKWPPFGSAGGVCYIKFVNGNGSAAGLMLKSRLLEADEPQSVHLQPPSEGF